MLNAPALLTSTACNECPIRQRAVCSLCDEQELDMLEDMKFYRSFEAGQTIVWAGDRMDFLGSVVHGIATLSQTMEDGRTQMVGLLLPADFAGRPGRAGAAYNVTASTDVLMCCFRRKPFEAMMVTTPHVAHRLLEMTLDELDAAREWMLVLGRKTAREKIASLLSIFARRTAVGSILPLQFELPLTREAMADYLGLTLETVSRQMSALRKDGVIQLDGKRRVVVPDLDRLMEAAGDDNDGGVLG